MTRHVMYTLTKEQLADCEDLHQSARELAKRHGVCKATIYTIRERARERREAAELVSARKRPILQNRHYKPFQDGTYTDA